MVFSTFFNFSLNLAIRNSWSKPQSAPGLEKGGIRWDWESTRPLCKGDLLQSSVELPCMTTMFHHPPWCFVVSLFFHFHRHCLFLLPGLRQRPLSLIVLFHLPWVLVQLQLKFCHHSLSAVMKLKCLLLGRKAMTNLNSILKSRNIILQTNVCLVKAVIFPVSHMDVRVGL